MSEPRTIGKRSDRSSPGRVPLLDPGSPAGAALRTAVAATGAMALAFALHLEVPALAVVFVLARGSAGAVTMLSGALAGSAAGIVLLQFFDQSPVAFSLALLLVTAVGTYGTLGRSYPYWWVQALLSLLILVGQALNTPDTAVRHAFFGVAAVLIAAIASFVAGASPPAAVPALLQDALAFRLRTLARAAARGADAPAVIALERATRRSHALLANAWPTRLASHARFRALDAATTMVGRVHDGVLVLLARDRLASSASHAGAAAEDLAAALRLAAARVAARRGPIDDARGEREADARATAARIRRTPLGAGDPLSFAVLRAGRRLLARLALLSPSLLPGTRSAPRLAERADRGAPPVTLDRYRLRHSVKSAASYLLILWAWVASEWGAIVPALVVSVLVATLATPVGATLRKALLRVAGVLVGGLAGLLVAIVLLPFVTELPTICAVAGAFLLAFLWIQQRHERLAFAALQAAIAFVLTLVHGTAPSPSWREPLESLVGLAFGITVVVGIMHAAWPIDATTSAHANLGDLLDACGRRLARLLDPQAPGDGTAERNARRAATRARELAVGFVHEVELYGTQFGRPAEDLARLARPVLELDALVGFLESLPLPAPDAGRDPSSRGPRGFASAATQDCGRLAAGLRALPGERASCTTDDLASPRCLPQLAPSGAGDDATRAEACALIAALLNDLARALGDDDGLRRRDAA